MTSLISSFTADSKRVPVKVGRIRPDAILSGLKFKKRKPEGSDEVFLLIIFKPA